MKKELLNELNRNRQIMGLISEQSKKMCSCNGVDLGPFPADADCMEKCKGLQKKNCTGARANPPTHKFMSSGACIKLNKEEIEKNRRAALSNVERQMEDNVAAKKKDSEDREALPYEKPKTKVPRREPFVRVKEGKKENTIEIVAKGEFPVNVTESGLSDAFIAKVLETIMANKDGAKMLETGNMNITFAQVKGSASNYFDGPVKPTHSNTQKTPNFEDESFYTGDQAKNNKLALQRGQNLFKELQKKLPGKRINISAKPKFEQRITDTGGVYDEWRDVRKRPRAGQFVTVKATLEIIPLEIIEEIRCLTDMKVTVGYYAKISDLETAQGKADEPYASRLKKSISYSKTINKGRENPKGHQCNEAVFAVWLNQIKIGTVNLNNAGGPKDKGEPGTPGGSREKTITISNRLATNIAKTEKDGTVTFYLEPKSQDSHSDTPWIRIVTGQGKELLNAAAETISTYNGARGSDGKMEVFGPFNPCDVVT